MQTTSLLQSERVGEKEKMNKYNIRFNLEEDKPININISKNRTYNPFTHKYDYTGKPRYISSMSGGLEHKLAKVYRKIINKALKYKKNIFE
jgi:hypothetical protein